MSDVSMLRACGGNVLLRRVRQDGALLWIQGYDSRVLQLAEVMGLGGRWTQDRPWTPPAVTPRRAPLDSGGWDPNWKPPDLSAAPPRPLASFTPMHASRLCDLTVGALVVFAQPRVYDVFRWGEDDILVYPGNWLYGVVTETALADAPERRRYELDSADDPRREERTFDRERNRVVRRLA